MKQFTREPVPAPTRGHMTPARRARLFLRDGGRCAYCHEKVGLRWDADHVVALDLGGADTDDNLVVACVGCHKAKTSGHDAPAIAKMRRQRAMAEAEPTGSIQSRGFDNRLTKGFDGKVKPRRSRSASPFVDPSAVGESGR